MLRYLDLILRSMEATEKLEAREEGQLHCALGRSLCLKGGDVEGRAVGGRGAAIRQWQ